MAERRRRRWVLVALALLVLGECGARLGRNAADPEGAGVSFRFDYHHADSRLLRWAMSRAGGFDDSGVFMAINGQGRRGTRDHALARPEGVRRRVAVVGTGNAFGFRVPDGATWPERLEAALNEAGAGAEVLNFAYPGSTVVHLERTVLDEVLAHRPDVVVVAYGGYNEALASEVPESEYVDPEARLRNLLRGSALFRELEGLGLRVVAPGPREARVPVAEFEARLAEAVARLARSGARVLLLREVVVYPDVPGWWAIADMDAYSEAVERVGAAQGVPVLDPASVLPPPGPARDAAFVDRLVYGPEACAAVGRLVASALSP